MSGVFRNYSFKKWIYQSTSLSTNADISLSVSKNSPNTNIVLYTYKQWAGKGQIGRKWHSGVDKNLTLSLLVAINQLLAKDQFHFNMIISLSIRDWIASTLADSINENVGCFIKWPNDIYINDKKLAGILIQNSLADKYITKSTVGIGINVNEDNFPLDLPNPISMAEITGNKYNLGELFANLLYSLERLFFDYDQMSFDELKKQYISKMYLLNQEKTFTLSETGQIFSGKIVGINDEGMLEVDQKGRMSRFNFREIRYNN